ncbi:MAG: serine/threonine protein kinase [Anaerolineae bacterium]|nr:serine/threonine protein kinase [Anaerolineae bacterium]
MTTPHIPDSLPGQMLDDYLIETLLGHGGMARVYRAWDTKVRRYVAIKVIDKPFRGEADYIDRFEREAQAIGQLQHPNIVTLYRYGEAEGLLYMAMQYIEGADLATLLEQFHHKDEFIPPEDASRIMREICAALDYAHNRGVIHRDVKPNNILIGKDGRSFLTDFGLALLTEVGTQGEIFGSPHYISPEQAISSSGAIPQSDFYSLGVVLYEMFTGQVPFNAVNPLDISMLHMTEPPPSPRQLRSEIAPEIEAVILKTLEKEPINRYPSGTALATALDHAIQPNTLAVRQSILEAVTLEVKRNPLPPAPAIANAPLPTRPIPPKLATVPATSAATTMPHRKLNQRWIWAAVSGGVVLLLLLIGGLVLLLTNDGEKEPDESQGQNPETLSLRPSEAVIGSPAPTVTLAVGQPSVLPASTTTPFPTLTTSAAATIPDPTLAPTLTLPVTVSSEVSISTQVIPPVAGNYAMTIAQGKKDSLIIANSSQTLLNPALLVFRSSKNNLEATFQDISPLFNGQCLAIVKRASDSINQQDVNCALAASPVVMEGKEFWKEPFAVYYDTVLVGFCESDPCSLEFAPQQPINEPQIGYALMIGRDKDSLAVFNLTVAGLPLAHLSLVNQNGQLSGAQWQVTVLNNGQCAVVRTKDEAHLPPGLCNDPSEVVGALTQAENFWEQPFAVYYANRMIGFCGENTCTIDFAIPLSFLIPPDRMNVPPGSVLLTGGIGLSTGAQLSPGDMQIEGYCTGLGYTADHTETEWFCKDTSNNAVLPIGVNELDAICRATYNRQTAFALLQGSSPTIAFNWRCYGY